MIGGAYDGDYLRLFKDGKTYIDTINYGTIQYGSGGLTVATYDIGQLSDYYFTGRIEYILYYDRILSEAEAAWLYRSPYCIFTDFRIQSLVEVAGEALFKTVYETITMSDAVTKLTGKAIVESLSFLDVTAKSFGKSLTEDLSLADVPAKAFTLDDLAESITILDSLAKLAGKNLTEGFTLTDIIVKSTAKVVVESLTVTDDVDGALIVIKQLFESFQLADSLIKTPGKVVTEGLTLSDVIVKAFAKGLTESITLVDSVEGLLATVKTLYESFSLSDVVSKSTLKMMEETLTVADEVRKLVEKGALTESITIGDSLDRLPGRLLSESIVITDVITRVASFIRTLPESITISDTVLAALVTEIMWQLYGKLIELNRLKGKAQ